MSRLEFPGIIGVYDCFQEDRSLYLMLEYALNGDLAKFMSRVKLGHSAKVHYIAQLVSTLEYLRSSNIVHRDLKPENLLLDENFNLKLADFGSAKILTPPVEKLTLRKGHSASRVEMLAADRTQNVFAQQDELLVGTEAYISPEAINSRNAQFESDLWSLGVIIWQLFDSN